VVECWLDVEMDELVGYCRRGGREGVIYLVKSKGELRKHRLRGLLHGRIAGEIISTTGSSGGKIARSRTAYNNEWPGPLKPHEEWHLSRL
jgi:hypothetical protein